MTSLTAASTPSTSAPEFVRTCSKCRGKGVGDFGMYVKSGRCSACDNGKVFTAVAFATVIALRADAEALRIADAGKALVAASGDQNEIARLRTFFRAAVTRSARARAIAAKNPTTVAMVRIAVFGENDTYHAAK